MCKRKFLYVCSILSISGIIFNPTIVKPNNARLQTNTSMSRVLSFVGVTRKRRGCQSERSCCGTTTGNCPDKDLGMAPSCGKKPRICSP